MNIVQILLIQNIDEFIYIYIYIPHHIVNEKKNYSFQTQNSSWVKSETKISENKST